MPRTASCRSRRPRPIRCSPTTRAKNGWTNVFRTCGRDDAQGRVAGNYIAAHFKGKPVAIVQDKSAYGKGLADETKKAMNAAGMKEAMYESVNQGDKDFSALISKMKQANVAAIYYGGYYTEAGLMIRQAKEQGLDAVLMGGDALASEDSGRSPATPARRR